MLLQTSFFGKQNIEDVAAANWIWLSIFQLQKGNILQNEFAPNLSTEKNGNQIRQNFRFSRISFVN